MPDKGGIDCKNKKVIVKRMRIIPCVSQLPYFIFIDSGIKTCIYTRLCITYYIYAYNDFGRSLDVLRTLFRI